MTETNPRVFGDYYKWFLVVVLFTMWAVTTGIQYSFGIFFKSLQDALGSSRGTISWAMTIYLLALALSIVPAGWLVDRFSFRSVYSIAAFWFGIPLALCSRVSEPWQLYWLYGLMGVSAGICGPSLFTVIARWFTEKRGLAMGLISAGVGFGSLIASPLTNALIASHGWRNTFVILGLASTIILFICSQSIKNPQVPASDQPLLATGTSAGGTQAPPSSPLCAMTFGQAIKTREIMSIIAVATAAQIAAKMIMVHIVPHATDMGISRFAAAMALSTIGFGSMLGRIVMGFVQDWIGPKRSLIICMTAMGVCLFALPFITADAAFFVFAILFGLAYGGDVPQIPALTVQCFGVASMGTIYAFVSGAAHLISSLGPFAAGYIFDVTHSYAITFLGAGVLLFLGALSISRIK